MEPKIGDVMTKVAPFLLVAIIAVPAFAVEVGEEVCVSAWNEEHFRPVGVCWHIYSPDDNGAYMMPFDVQHHRCTMSYGWLPTQDPVHKYPPWSFDVPVDGSPICFTPDACGWWEATATLWHVIPQWRRGGMRPIAWSHTQLIHVTGCDPSASPPQSEAP